MAGAQFGGPGHSGVQGQVQDRHRGALGGEACGDGGAVTSAKNTILYAVIGLIVAIFAWAIVDFVIDNLAK